MLGINEETCKVFGKERGKLRKSKNMIDNFDLLIASTCLCNNLTLLTNNVKHYGKVEDLKILSLSQTAQSQLKKWFAFSFIVYFLSHFKNSGRFEKIIYK